MLQVPRAAFRSAAMAQMLADELGPYGFKPEACLNFWRALFGTQLAVRHKDVCIGLPSMIV